MAEPALASEERDMLAAEFALGLLVGEARAQALRLQLSDSEFRRDVETWEQRFMPLILAVQDVPPPHLWPAIEARLTGAANDGGSAVVTLRRRDAAWRIGALASGAVAAGLAVLLVFRPVSVPQAPVAQAPVAQAARQAIVAQLGTGEGAAQLVANYDPDRAELRIRAVKLPASALTPELWVIPAGGAPLSLGLVAAQGASTVAVPASLRAQLRDGATLAITLEPREGAPHMAPSSTPIAVGTMHRL